MRGVGVIAIGWGACTGHDHHHPHPDPTDPLDLPVPTVDAEVEDGGEVRCADPTLRDATKYGLAELRDEKARKRWFWGNGLVAADFDQDGQVDLVIPGFWETEYFHGTPGGGWVELPWGNVAPGTVPLGAASGGTAADYDGDGDLDLLIIRYQGKNKLLRNDGTRFTDVSLAAGISDEPRRSMVSSWGDLDHDGDLDLYIGCYGYIDEASDDPDHSQFDPAEPDWLYLNNGDGTFTDVSDRLPQSVHDGYALAGGFLDLDDDGWLDLYVVNDFGNSFPNQLLWNRQGVLVLDGNAHGLDIAATGMGVAVGDLNGDGIDDLVVAAWDGNHTMLSGAGGRAWFESVAIVGPDNDLHRAQKIAWGGDLVDMDDDGDLDLPMSYGYLDSNYPASQQEPDAMYLQGSDGALTDAGKAWGVNQPGSSRGFVVTDFNDDGYPDLIKRQTDGPPQVFTSNCGSAAWLRVTLDEPGPNRFAVGARIVVHADGQSRRGAIRAGSTNLASGGPPEAHFGLGSAESVDAIEVWWPDGEISVVEDLGVRRDLRISRR